MYSTIAVIQGLASSEQGWHRVNRQEELLMEEGEEVRDGRAEGPSAIGDRGQAVITLTPDIEGT